MVLDTIFLLPASFWVVLLLLGGGAFWALGQMRTGLGIPVLVVLVTVASWYVIDVLYNDYVHTYAVEFTPAVRDEAWWEVVIFLVAFLLLAPGIHAWVNRWDLRRTSQIWQMSQGGYDKPQIQRGLEQLLWGCVIGWAVLSAGAFIRLGGDAIYYFCPYLPGLPAIADPWARDRIGAGFDFLWTVALHVHMFLAAMFGILLALLKNPKYRAVALFGVVTAWPYIIFGRTRNYMLAVVIPGVLAWVFLRLRTHILIKIVVLGFIYSLVSAWFAFVMIHRSEIAVAYAFNEEGFDTKNPSEVHEEGLNMFGELCWINTFIDKGIYKPNGGQRYLAELVNPIPRTIWPNKPLIGIDYAKLRGQGWNDAEEGNAGVGATISTGMIGQGVVNFGQVFGPAAAAFLMCLWVALLARLDLYGERLGRIPLYGLGLILTFNLGRDITFLTLYTFMFGAMLVWLVDRKGRKKASKAKTVSHSQAQGKVPVPSGISDGASLDSSPSDHENPVPVSSSSASPD